MATTVRVVFASGIGTRFHMFADSVPHQPAPGTREKEETWAPPGFFWGNPFIIDDGKDGGWRMEDGGCHPCTMMTDRRVMNG